MFCLLDEMRGRLGMFLGTTSLTKLAAFLRGYDYALEKCGGGSDPFLGGFRDWIQRRYQATSRSWENVILDHSADEVDGVRLFWELLDEFRQNREDLVTANGPMDSKKQETTTG
jgi:hypothetical protein